MKTQSIKSLAALLGVAIVTNVSALAGPGPQPQSGVRRSSEVHERKVSDHKKVVFVATRQEDGKALESATQSRSVAFYAGSHGGIAIR